MWYNQLRLSYNPASSSPKLVTPSKPLLQTFGGTPGAVAAAAAAGPPFTVEYAGPVGWILSVFIWNVPVIKEGESEISRRSRCQYLPTLTMTADCGHGGEQEAW